jgi:hypothetical protein
VTPIAHFEVLWKRCSELSALHAYLASNVTGALHPEEILRAEWVARVAALDPYVHELTAQRMVAIFEGRLPSTPGYQRFVVPNETLDRIRQAIVAKAPSVVMTPASASAAFDLHVRTNLGRKTFQYPDDIADAVRLCSGVELWNEVASHLGAPPANKSAAAKSMKKTLSLVIERRNKIAHEGDLQPPPREPWPISQADVAFVAQQLERIVRAIDAVV